MNAAKTAAVLSLVTLLVAGSGAAATTDAPSAVQAENTTVDHGGEAVTLVTGSNATVTGETTLDAGTDLTLVMRSSGSSPFLASSETTVREDGRFVATFDLADKPDGANATLTVRSGDETLAEVPVHLVAEPTPTASPTPEPTDSPTASNTSSGDGPGFGGLAALLAVLGTAPVIARRR